MQLKLTQIKKSPKAITLILERPADLPTGRQGFHFYPGQYLDISMKGDTRAFSIASSPTEGELMITTRPRKSKFKKDLIVLKAGDIIESSHPAGTFILDETEPAVLIAGGVGITPFRSMIKYCVDQKISTPITLIYSNSDKDFLFKEELDQWQKVLSKLKIIYHNSSQKGHLNITQLVTIVEQNVINKAIFYLAGSHSFVNSMAQILIDSGVDETNIRYDRFDGYT